MKKTIVVGMILILIGANVVSGFQVNSMITSKPLNRGSWYYVGGNGPNNYTRIQDAIDDAGPGDSVFVYQGTYYESLTINKSVNVFGEDKELTIIDGLNSGKLDVVWVCTPYLQGSTKDVHFSGFTLRNAERGLFLISYIDEINLSDISIYDNIFTLNTFGIVIEDCVNCKIYRNIIKENHIGLSVSSGHNNSYTQNIIKDNSIGIFSDGYEPQVFEKNSIEDNEKGITLAVYSQNTIRYNNFIDNSKDINIWLTFYLFSQVIIYPLLHIAEWQGNHWDGNYWDRWEKTRPKPIVSFFILMIMVIRDYSQLIIPLGIYPYIKFDWHPVQEPYDIP